MSLFTVCPLEGIKLFSTFTGEHAVLAKVAIVTISGDSNLDSLEVMVSDYALLWLMGG